MHTSALNPMVALQTTAMVDKYDEHVQVIVHTRGHEDRSRVISIQHRSVTRAGGRHGELGKRAETSMNERVEAVREGRARWIAWTRARIVANSRQLTKGRPYRSILRKPCEV